MVIDENLPQTLVPKLGLRAVHATELGERLSDQQLWQHARQQGSVLLTKDADFFDRLSLEGPTPKVIWVRLGNLRRAALESAVLRHWPQVIELLETNSLVEIHPDRLEAINLGPGITGEAR